jgi:16S rRNA (cytosine967-C5)-methyltransferase
MRPGARILAAAEVLTEVIDRHRPTAMALADWGKAHRFAGSGDRNAIGGLVYDALRRRLSIGWAMNEETALTLAIGTAPNALAMTPEEVAAACDGSQHSPQPLTEAQIAGLTRGLTDAPEHVQADVPEWLWPSFQKTFGDRAVEQGRKLAERAATDLRVNSLKSTQEKVLKALRDYRAQPTALSPVGVRIPAASGPQRTPNLQAEAAYQAGWFEVQDEGSQIAALMAEAGPRLQVLDLCAGAGGKTLAMAAQMQNTGQIYAYDEDRTRLKPIFDRLKRAGARNVQVLRAGDREALDALGARFDLVLVDAPCTGTGVWRRRPEAKWKLRAEALVQRQHEQDEVLAMAARYVKPGGRIVYVTCSLLPEENTSSVERFLAAHGRFTSMPWADIWRARLSGEPPRSADGRDDGLLLTPADHATDGFYVAVLKAAE